MERRGSVPPHGCSWERYVDALVGAHGGWAALVDALIRRAGDVVDLPGDPQSIEKGLRRLASRDNAPGGQYGRWLLRFFAAPEPIEATARWMGQYHSRFSDLPLQLRRSQLLLWDRPPIAESPLAPWIHLGLASVALRTGESELVRQRLRRARARPLEKAVRLEADLLAARLARDEGDSSGAGDILGACEAVLDELEDDERQCYLARLLDQRAYGVIRDRGDLEAARAHYERIPAVGPPFVRFRRAHGLAYCAWKRGDDATALAQARAACTHAGDGGFVGFRAMALELLGHILLPADATAVQARAAEIRRSLGSEPG